jgi:hypothetical protein
MIGLGFVYFTFTTYMSYIILEKGHDCYKDRMFWVLLVALFLLMYLTIRLFNLF